MARDDFQQAWHAASTQTRVTVDADILLREIQRNQRDFLATILRRDLFEVGTALLLLPIWVYLGSVFSLPWSWYLGVPAIAWIAAFILYYRLRYPLRVSEPDAPLLECARQSLTLVERQIWLLRNVFWWYLLPPGISILVFFGHVAWLRSESGLTVPGRVDVFIILIGIYSFLYLRNKYAVNSELEPRREELLTLLASLGDSDSLGRAREYAVTSSVQKSKCGSGGVGLGSGLLVTGLCVLALVAIPLTGGLFDSDFDQPPRTSGPAGDKLASLVTDLRKENNLVGLAAMVMVDGQIEAAAAEGERKKGSGVPVEIADRWHIGGIAKSITATMIARLVESGRMNWTDKVGDVFAEPSVHEDWKSVMLKQLLTDTAGAPRNFALEVRRRRPPLGPQCTEARREAVLEVVAHKPEFSPGSQYAYSNVGHTIAAAMAEKVTGIPWEELVKREVFEPLALMEAGFGPPESPDATLPQPRGHHTVQGWKISVDDQTDNTTIMAPSGLAHMSLENLCTYAREHLLGQLAMGKLLPAETYQLLHTPERSYYAYGWIKREPSASMPFTVYWHNGSNTMWYALVAFIPEKNMVIAVTSNDGDFEKAEAAAWEIVRASTNQFEGDGDRSARATPPAEGYPKLSPFAAVRWGNELPEVKVGDEWFQLVSLDDIPATKIIAFSQKTYGDKWQKRFEEDLVELLTRMGHLPQDTVTLVVQSLTSPEKKTLKDVPITRANRQAIRDAAQAREANAK